MQPAGWHRIQNVAIKRSHDCYTNLMKRTQITISACSRRVIKQVPAAVCLRHTGWVHEAKDILVLDAAGKLYFKRVIFQTRGTNVFFVTVQRVQRV